MKKLLCILLIALTSLSHAAPGAFQYTIRKYPVDTGFDTKQLTNPASIGFVMYDPDPSVHDLKYITLGSGLSIASGVLNASTSQLPGDWLASSGPTSISNKPTLGNAASLNVPLSGNASNGEIVLGNDSRLTDSRTPTAHTHLSSDITDSTATGRSILTSANAAAVRTAIGAGTSSFTGAYPDLTSKPTLGTASALDVATSGNATSTQVVKGNDTRLTDARTPTAHTHVSTDITDTTAIGRSVMTASTAAAARTAIGAGTFNTPTGTTSQCVRGDGSVGACPLQARTKSYVTKAVGTCFQLSTTRDARVEIGRAHV